MHYVADFQGLRAAELVLPHQDLGRQTALLNPVLVLEQQSVLRLICAKLIGFLQAFERAHLPGNRAHSKFVVAAHLRNLALLPAFIEPKEPLVGLALNQVLILPLQNVDHVVGVTVFVEDALQKAPLAAWTRTAAPRQQRLEFFVSLCRSYQR